MEKTSEDDWADGEDIQIPQIQKPNPEDMYGPTEKAESEDEMDMGMVGLLESWNGRGDAKERVVRDAEETLKLVRDLGGQSRHASEKGRRRCKALWLRFTAPQGSQG